jgi:hypothetical protein
MSAMFGDFGSLTDALMAAAIDAKRWDAAMDAAAKATGSFGAVLLPTRGRAPLVPKSESLQSSTDAYVREGWVHRDVR